MANFCPSLNCERNRNKNLFLLLLLIAWAAWIETTTSIPPNSMRTVFVFLFVFTSAQHVHSNASQSRKRSCWDLKKHFMAVSTVRRFHQSTSASQMICCDGTLNELPDPKRFCIRSSPLECLRLPQLWFKWREIPMTEVLFVPSPFALFRRPFDSPVRRFWPKNLCKLKKVRARNDFSVETQNNKKNISEKLGAVNLFSEDNATRFIVWKQRGWTWNLQRERAVGGRQSKHSRSDLRPNFTPIKRFAVELRTKRVLGRVTERNLFTFHYAREHCVRRSVSPRIAPSKSFFAFLSREMQRRGSRYWRSFRFYCAA